MINKEHVWLDYCKSCKKKHYVKMGNCPSCNGRGGQVVQLVSDKVAEICNCFNDECCGCEAYREHLY